MSKNSRKARKRNRSKRVSSQNNEHSRLHVINNSSCSLECCPCCGNKLNSDKELIGLSYCPHCSLFFWLLADKSAKHTLFSTLEAIKRIGGSDILFSERIPGLVSSIIPMIEEGKLEILRKLSTPESQIFVEAIQTDEDLSYILIDNFASKVGLDIHKVISICNDLRRILQKSTISNIVGDDFVGNNCILSFYSSVTKVLSGEKVKFEWNAVKAPHITYAISYENGISKNVNPKGSLWITVKSSQDVTLKAFYKKKQEIASKTIIIRVASPPSILQFFCEASSPVMETEKMTIRWKVENAERLTLIHRYNDHEKLSIDVTDHEGVISFTALRTEVLELVAERLTAKESKSIMIEVRPLPKFNVSSIPQIFKVPDIDIARVPDFSEKKNTEIMFRTLKEILSLSNLRPYQTYKENLREISRLFRSIFR